MPFTTCTRCGKAIPYHGLCDKCLAELQREIEEKQRKIEEQKQQDKKK